MRSFSIALLTIAAAWVPARGAEESLGSSPSKPTSGGDAARVFQALEESEAQSELSPEVRANLIDKGEIAERTMQRAVGLREAGNPHIAEGILLRELQEDPERSRVDLDRLREEQIQMVERRSLDEGRPAALRLPSPEGSSPDASPPPPGGVEPAPPSDRGLFRVAFLAASIVLVLCGVFIYLRQ